MSDEHIAETLRSTLAGRAETVTHGPGWDDADEPLDTTPPHRSRARWIAPLAAAAVVLAVVGAVFAVRSGRNSNQSVTTGQRPIPAGMKAVDALGVEIFVPDDYTIDANPCRGVLRPIALPAIWRAADCPTMLVPTVTIRAVSTMPKQPGPCRAADTVTLDGDRGCVTRNPNVQPDALGGFYEISWLRLGVALSSWGPDAKTAMAIIKSAHAVPVDRNGCAARDGNLATPAPTPVKNLPDPANIAFDSELLPVSPRSMSVCWYIGNRLVASALLDRSAAQQVIAVANGMPPKWPAPKPQPALPSCDDVAEHDGVLLTAHLPGHPDVTAVADFAACNGQRTSRSATAAFLTTSELADALAHATGIPITLGYSTAR